MKIAFVYNLKRNQSIEQAEFDTPETIEAISNALKSGKHEVVNVEMTLEKNSHQWIERLSQINPDILFNTAEGHYGIGRESLGPTVFEQLQIPYVGSGPYGCFLTLDKFLTKQMVASRQVPVVEGYFVNNTEDLKSILKDVVFPVFVKPNYEGSSKGITQKSICKDPEELLAYGQECIKLFPSGILIEKFIPGRDLSIPYIAGIGDQGVLEPLEYILKSSSENNIYDYDYKNLIDDHVEVRCPALLTPSQRALIVEMMKKVVSATGVVDFGRADFRITPDGDIYFLELNALPSLQPDAGLFLSSKLLGLDYNQTILKILEGAIARLKLSDKTPRTPRRIQTKIPKIGLVYNLKRKQAGEEGYENEAEFDSEKTVSALKSAIEKMNLPVIPIEATKTLSENLKEHKIDIVFNIAEGSNKRAREAQVPAICDLLGIEHTGSDATCLAITLDKAVTKKLLSQDGILTPNYRLYTGAKTFENGLKYPVIVKPNYEGTSKGIHQNSVVTNTKELQELVLSLWNQFHEPVLCEEYIEGSEYTVGILGNQTLKVLGPLEIKFKESSKKYPVYSFEAKQSNNNPYCDFICPAPMSKELERKIHHFSKKVFKLLACRDIARVDFRVNAKNEVFFLEINPLPGLSPGFSDLVIMAEKTGLPYDLLIKRILTPAIQRWRNLGNTKLV